MTRTLIVGTGDMAYALCHLFKNHNYNPVKHCLAVTKPGLEKHKVKNCPAFHDTGVPLVQMDDSIHISDIIILAIPASALKPFLNKYFPVLKSKILVDVTNSGTPGEDLHAMLGLTQTPWVKAFNDNGAVDLLLDLPHSKKPKVTNMCGNNLDAIATVKTFAEEALGFSVKIVPCEHYLDIAMHQNSLGDDWVYATYIMLILFVLTEVYALVRYNVWKGYDWFHLPIQVTNKAICWTALNAFALTMLPGLMARFFDTLYADKSRNKPWWIVSGLKIRKALGLLALWFLVIHIIMSLLIFNQKYYGKFFIDPKASSSKMNAVGEFSFLFAVLGAGFYFILGICSLPSVGMGMTYRSWQLVYGPLAWVALAFGTIHVLIMGVKGWSEQEKWPGNMPPITMTSVLLPLLVMFLKLVQVVTVYLTSTIFAGIVNEPTHNAFVAESMRTLVMGDGEPAPPAHIPPMSNALTPYTGNADSGTSSSDESSDEVQIVSHHHAAPGLIIVDNNGATTPTNPNSGSPGAGGSSNRRHHHKGSSKRRSQRSSSSRTPSFRDSVAEEMEHAPY